LIPFGSEYEPVKLFNQNLLALRCQLGFLISRCALKTSFGAGDWRPAAAIPEGES
jgi:hypothetical protein